jgi:prepilin-type N-terminal cleavage/methylation domain-containing protein
MNNTKKGFTLVELLVVIAILAILATVSVVGYTSFINRADESNATTEAHQIQTIIETALITDTTAIIPTKSGDTTKYIVATKNANGTITFAAAVETKPTTGFDLSTDLAEFAGKLELSGTTLVYKYSTTVTVDVMTNKVVE